MKYYKLKTYNTSYYFPKISRKTEFMYNLFFPYSLKAKIYWFLWKNTILKYQYQVNLSEEVEVVRLIEKIDGGNSIMSYCLGTPGIEQKISILGYDKNTKKPFFAKFSQNEAAMSLTLNEIKILGELKDTGIVPILYKEQVAPDSVFVKTEYISGKKLECIEIDNTIIELLCNINSIKISYNCDKTNLQTSLSHGDFCPWNILKTKNKLRLIDWEMAKNRPLGYDLFTYICQSNFLMRPNYKIEQIFNDNKPYIDLYFSHFKIHDYKGYLCWFAGKKIEYEKTKNGDLLPFYLKLYDYASKL